MKKTDDFYQEYGKYHIWFNQLNLESPSTDYAWRKSKKIVENETIKAIEQIESKKVIRIADIGCGNGALLIRIAKLLKSSKKKITFEGFDISEDFIEYAKKAAKYMDINNCDWGILNLEVDDLKKEYDVIICCEVLEHLNEPDLVLGKVYKHLRVGGKFILTTPNGNNWIKFLSKRLKKKVEMANNQELKKYLSQDEEKHKLAEGVQHIKVYDQKELLVALIQIGFRIEKTPRSSLVFGGPILDNHPLLLATMIVVDKILDIWPIPQLGWDSIVIAKKV